MFNENNDIRLIIQYFFLYRVAGKIAGSRLGYHHAYYFKVKRKEIYSVFGVHPQCVFSGQEACVLRCDEKGNRQAAQRYTQGAGREITPVR